MRPDIGRDRAAGNGAWIAVGQIDDCHAVAHLIDLLGGRHDFIGEIDIGVARALLEHASIAHHQQAGDVREAPVGEHARALFGADAGAVAEHQAEQGQRVAGLFKSASDR